MKSLKHQTVCRRGSISAEGEAPPESSRLRSHDFMFAARRRIRLACLVILLNCDFTASPRRPLRCRRAFIYVCNFYCLSFVKGRAPPPVCDIELCADLENTGIRYPPCDDVTGTLSSRLRSRGPRGENGPYNAERHKYPFPMCTRRMLIYSVIYSLRLGKHRLRERRRVFV